MSMHCIPVLYVHERRKGEKVCAGRQGEIVKSGVLY